MKEVIEAARQISELKIQGATNIAMFAVKEMVKFAQRNKSLSRKELWNQLIEVEKIFTKTRSTEPGMRNGLMYILGKLQHDQSQGISTDLPKMTEIYGSEYEKILKEAKKSIAQYGSNLIPDNLDKPYIVQTHCHSSIVEAILIEAHNQGKNFIVVSSETRPFYQGRITAKKLSEAGIKVVQVVDSAMRWIANNYNSDIIVIGADAITSEGTVLNKIGSRLLALVAREIHIPLYVASPLLKYNPGTAFGNYEKIEMRDTKEIWKDWTDRPKNLTYMNPAFETINRVYISGVITEAGIYPSGQVHLMFSKTYPFLQEAYRIIEHGSPSEIF